jgi:uncharacterized membrane protein
MIKLIGILVVAVGFGLRLNTLVVVMAAGVATGLVSGLSFQEIMELFGKYFVENRYMTLPIVLMVPLIGLLERHGLQERAVTLIRRARAATAGRVILVYALARQVSVALGLNIGGSGGAHASFVRPLVAPMAEAAARLQFQKAALRAEAAARLQLQTAALRAEAAARLQFQKAALRAEGAEQVQPAELPDKTVAAIRATAAAGENTGNFFGEDVFIAVGAILLMKGYFDAIKIEVNVLAMALWGLPTALVASCVLVWRTRALDRRVARDIAEVTGTTTKDGP